ncbi:MAG: stage IV sporulation protein A [Lachnospiraceae bacterium]|nr:stage IV sporulation protein A [Lachnospiraceae bacterium]
MTNTTIYQDIAKRTGGDIYIGVCGPVRTGKSTFIKRFMDLLVLPHMEDGPEKERAKDELPQSAAGKTIMTTEPKFIPKDGAVVTLSDGTEMKVRMVDCVGYMVEGAVGHEEDGGERMVKTPWFDYEIPFTKAAEIGTRKVIHDHSTIGIVVTTDGSIGDIAQESYLKPEEQTIQELKELGKPFVILLNSKHPYSDETVAMAEQLEAHYGVKVLPVNCMQLRKEDILKILDAVLHEFPVTEIAFYMPKWTEILANDHPVKSALIHGAKKLLHSIGYIKDVVNFSTLLQTEDDSPVQKVSFEGQDLSNGSVRFRFDVDQKHYFDMLSQMTGMEITSDYHLFSMLQNYAQMKNKYSKVADALDAVKAKGYGVVTPERDAITLAEPELMRSNNKFGVKIKATAPSIHLIQTNIMTEIAPIVGTEEQAMDLMEFIKQNSQTSAEGIWETNIFGKTIEQIVEDGISTKLTKLSEETRDRMKGTLEKITNDSNRGVICIIL